MNVRACFVVSLVCVLLGTGSAGVPATEFMQSQPYEITTETGMPHLEENLRYARVTECRSMSRQDLSAAFWMLRDVSLQDCVLAKTAQDADSAVYVLQCSGGHGTTGDARWQFDGGRLIGTLNVRLGGKNMTFYQRVTARPLGECPAQAGG